MDQTGTLSEASKLALFEDHEIPFIWHVMEPHIKRALDRQNDWSLEDIQRALIENRANLWSSVKDGKIQGALVTMTIQYPQTKGLLYLCVGGENMSDWWEHRGEIENFARKIGCDFLEAWVRPGWVRKLAGDGWRETTRVIRKQL